MLFLQLPYSANFCKFLRIFANLMDNIDSQHNLLSMLSVNDKVVVILPLIHDLTNTQSEVSQANVSVTKQYHNTVAS